MFLWAKNFLKFKEEKLCLSTPFYDLIAVKIEFVCEWWNHRQFPPAILLS